MFLLRYCQIRNGAPAYANGHRPSGQTGPKPRKHGGFEGETMDWWLMIDDWKDLSINNRQSTIDNPFVLSACVYFICGIIPYVLRITYHFLSTWQPMFLQLFVDLSQSPKIVKDTLTFRWSFGLVAALNVCSWSLWQMRHSNWDNLVWTVCCPVSGG